MEPIFHQVPSGYTKATTQPGAADELGLRGYPDLLRVSENSFLASAIMYLSSCAANPIPPVQRNHGWVRKCHIPLGPFYWGVGLVTKFWKTCWIIDKISDEEIVLRIKISVGSFGKNFQDWTASHGKSEKFASSKWFNWLKPKVSDSGTWTQDITRAHLGGPMWPSMGTWWSSSHVSCRSVSVANARWAHRRAWATTQVHLGRSCGLFSSGCA